MMLNYELNDFHLLFSKNKTKKKNQNKKKKTTKIWDVNPGCGTHDAFHQSYVESVYPNKKNLMIARAIPFKGIFSLFATVPVNSFLMVWRWFGITWDTVATGHL